MMINKRLINMVPETKKNIYKNVLWQWIGLICGAGTIYAISVILQHFAINVFNPKLIGIMLTICAVCITIRYMTTVFALKNSEKAAVKTKQTLRTAIYTKLIALRGNTNNIMPTSSVLQLSTEAVDQLEIYFGAYLPQFFYSMLAAITLFVIIGTMYLPSAIALIICIPLIPLCIAGVQTIAKKLLGKYWGKYTKLGDTFLENLQGLTTLKIYSSDELRHKKMNEEAESFRKVTMQVLRMQLNSITIMDIIALGGAAIGIGLAINAYSLGQIEFWQCFVVVMLSAEFFIPMRLLGSYFHIAMNGMAASKNIFKLLDAKEPVDGTVDVNNKLEDIEITNLSYKYEDKLALNNISLSLKSNQLIALVGESGSGKSTLAGILTLQNQDYLGEIKVNGVELQDITANSMRKLVTYVGFQSGIAQGKVRDVLIMAKPNASDEDMWSALKKVQLDDFFMEQDGLDTLIQSQASNLSGGQKQRLSLARALLHNTSFYIFDEATSSVDPESEAIIMDIIYALSKEKTVILITHRLANAVEADKIYVLENGNLCGSDTHSNLLKTSKEYANLWNTQQVLEKITTKEQKNAN